MPLHISTFKGGLDLDTNVNAYDNQHYPYALNLRILNDGNSTSGTLTSMEDSEVLINIPLSYTVVGLSKIRDNLILFTRNGATGKIYLIPFDSLSTGINLADYLLIEKQFNFGDNVQIVARYETPTLQKIYWVDGVNVPRFANIALTASDFVGMSLDEFNIVQEVTLSTPTLNSIITGTLKVGTVQYAYCLYNLGGSETGYSSASNPIPISLSSLNESNSLKFKGSNIGEISNKGVSIDISDIDTEFDRIRVIRIFYGSQNATPEINIIYEGSVSSSMTISDLGGDGLGTIILEDYRYIPNIFSATTLESKNDYLFAGNITENSFEVDFDARAYRFINYGGAQYARVYQQDGSYYQMSSANGYYPMYYTSGGGYVSTIESAYGIPEDADCINSYNVITNTGLEDEYKFKSNLSTLGGTGKYVDFNFTATERIIDSSTSNLLVYTNSGTEGYQDISNPFVLENLGYQRDEIYRFAFVFYDVYGRQSFAKWSADVRFPSEANGWWYSMSGSTIRDIGIVFTINAEGIATLTAQGVTSWQVVRAERTYSDATVKDCGYISSLIDETTSVVRWRDLPIISSSSNSIPKVVEYITPETNYNKNNYSPYSRLDIYEGATLVGLTSKNIDIDGATSVTFKLKGTTIEQYPEHRIISQSLLFPHTAKQEYTSLNTLGYYKNLNSRFGPLYSRDNASTDPPQYNRCTRGTTLLLQIDNNVTTAGVAYARRRSYSYPYGGSSFGSRLTTLYYSCSSVVPITTDTQNVYGGDCFIGWFENLRGVWSTDSTIIPSGSGAAPRMRNLCNQTAYLLVETKINLKYTVNPTWSYYDDGLTGDYYSDSTENSLLATAGYDYNAMQEIKGVYNLWSGDAVYYTQDYDLYTYNSVYSQMDKSKVFFSEPLDFTVNNTVDTRIYRTNKKINGENSDTWTKFLVNNQLDVDTSYGALTKLLTFNDKLFFVQNSAVGVISVAEREVVTTNSGSATTIGTGGVMERYDYISTVSGSSSIDSIVSSTKTIYYIDDNNKKLCRIGNGVEYLSDLKGLKSYTADAYYTTIAIIFNHNFNEIWFRLTDDIVVFNEYTDSFVTFIDEQFLKGVNYNGKTFTTGTLGGTLKVLKELDKANTYKDIELNLFINPNSIITDRFDSLTFSSTIDRSNTIQDKSFSTIALSNQYQTKTTSAFYPPARKRMRQFIYNSMRDDSGYRLLDSYLQADLTFTKSYVDERLKIHEIITNYMPINAR